MKTNLPKSTPIIITGASSGLGFALQGVARSSGYTPVSVIRRASDRAPEDDRNVFCDLANECSVQNAATKLCEKVKHEKQVVFVANAGILPPSGIATENFQDFSKAMKINCFSQIYLVDALARICSTTHFQLYSISSGMGSVTRALGGDRYAYSASKASLAIASRQIAKIRNNVDVAVLNPGWMRTKLGGADADYSSEESAQHILDLIVQQFARSEASEIGIWSVDGETLPW